MERKRKDGGESVWGQGGRGLLGDLQAPPACGGSVTIGPAGRSAPRGARTGPVAQQSPTRASGPLDP